MIVTLCPWLAATPTHHRQQWELASTGSVESHPAAMAVIAFKIPAEAGLPV
jgi:hypothetical protein